jgi:hypothetical protein
MLRKIGCIAIVALFALVVGNWTSSASAQPYRTGASGELFYNYYVPPQGAGSVGAQLYPSPRPTPPRVGHTFITYQALAPENYLYEHCRRYCRDNGNGSCTKTTICYKCMPDLFHILPGTSWMVPGQFGAPATPYSSCFPH